MDRQRLLILFGVAWISAALLSWFLYRNTVMPHQEQRTKIMATARDLPIGTRIAKKDLKTVTVLTRDVPRGAVLTEKDALDRIALYPIAANTPLSAISLSSVTGGEGISSTIDPGYRAVSVPITDASSVAGLVMPGSHVDVLFTRPGSMAEAVTTTILEDVVVLSIGRVTEVAQNTTIDPRATRPQNQAATLLVTPDQARKIELAKNQGKVSLSLRNPLDHEVAKTGGTALGLLFGGSKLKIPSGDGGEDSELPATPRPRRTAAAPRVASAVPTAAPAPRKEPPFVMEIISGNKKAETRFAENAEGK